MYMNLYAVTLDGLEIYLAFFVYKNVGVLNLNFHITNPNLI